MGKATGISWTDSTFNPWWGCVRVSPGCQRCYAEGTAARFGTGWGTTARRRFFDKKHWNEPLSWNRKAEKLKMPWLVFCSSMADVFELLPEKHPDVAAMDVARHMLWSTIAQTPALTWLLLTKRPENIAALLPSLLIGAANVWLGTTVEDRERASRLEHLRRVPAAVRFVSAEPLLEDIAGVDFTGMHWVIAGGESDPRGQARPFDLRWARNLREQCDREGRAFFFKQKGHNVLSDGKPVSCAGKGADASQWPLDLQRQDFPRVRAA